MINSNEYILIHLNSQNNIIRETVPSSHRSSR